jgi:hypothetical protein
MLTNLLLLFPCFLLSLLIIYNLLKIVYCDGEINRRILIRLTKVVVIFYIVVANVLLYNKLTSIYAQHKIEQKRIAELVDLGLKAEDFLSRLKKYKEQQDNMNKLLEEYYNAYWKKYWEEHQKSA